MAKKKADTEIGFEEAMLELEQITRSLEGGEMTLDESIKAYERGIELKKICSKVLENAEKKLQYIKQQKDGTLSAEPIEPGAEEEPDLF